MYFLLWVYETSREPSNVSGLLTAVYETGFFSQGGIDMFVEPETLRILRENASDSTHNFEKATSTLQNVIQVSTAIEKTRKQVSV